MISLKQQCGFLMITSIVLIVAIGALIAALSFMFTVSSRSSTNFLTSDQAKYIAESGLEEGVYRLKNGLLTCSQLSTLTNQAVGEGVYSLTGQLFFPSPAAQLSSSINASQTTIPVTTVTGYNAAGGRIMIDSETIDYTSTSTSGATCGGSAPCFLDANRGSDSTVASSHANNTRIGQFGCRIVSSGSVGVVDLDSKHALSIAIQRPFAVAVGKRTGWKPTIAYWDDASWQRYDTTGFPYIHLNGVDLVSYADGWAVGNKSSGNTTLLSWTGSSWSRFTPSPSVNTDLNAISCVDSNHCWAAGDRRGNDPLLMKWDGSDWDRFDPNLDISKNAYDVHCVSANDCWVVGEVYEVRRDDDEEDDDDDDGGRQFQPMLIHWNGSSWSEFILTSANRVESNLRSVHCVSSNDCWATGNADSDGAVFLHWNGSNWTRANPDSSISSNRDFHGIHCVASSDCWAVGDNGMIARYTGGNWSKFTPDSSVPSAHLRGIDCLKSDYCLAVGNRQGGYTTIIRWDGTNWYRVTNVSAGMNVHLASVSIVGPKGSGTSIWQADYY